MEIVLYKLYILNFNKVRCEIFKFVISFVFYVIKVWLLVWLIGMVYYVDYSEKVADVVDYGDIDEEYDGFEV